MPNHVTTRAVVTGEKDELGRFCNLFYSEDSQGNFVVDFNKIIPMPKILKDTVEGTVSTTGVVLMRVADGMDSAENDLSEAFVTHMRDELDMQSDTLQDVAMKFLDKHPDYEKYGALRLLAKAETGYYSWYSWALANWGTKWNAYDCRLEFQAEKYVEFCFNTAWSFPEPVFRKLAKMFPTLTFECDCYDEGGCFAGEGCFNPREGDSPFQFINANDAIFERVYGYPPDKYDEGAVSVEGTDTAQTTGD